MHQEVRDRCVTHSEIFVQVLDDLAEGLCTLARSIVKVELEAARCKNRLSTPTRLCSDKVNTNGASLEFSVELHQILCHLRE